ncbi:hypothetical protein JQV67_20475, partial [Sulfitobacter geojensis]
ARKAYRFATLGIEADYAGFLERAEAVIEEPVLENRREGEKEKERDGEGVAEQDGPEVDKDTYVKYGSDPDLKNDFTPQQDPEASTQPEDAFLDEMAERRAKREAQDIKRERSKGPRKR